MGSPISFVLGSQAKDTLLRATIIHRHGMRAPRLLLNDESFWDTRMPSSEELSSLARLFPVNPAVEDCSNTTLGRLTAAGLEQMRQAGVRLRQHYVDELQFMPHELDSLDVIRLWSTHPTVVGTERTVESVRGLLSGMYSSERLRLEP